MGKKSKSKQPLPVVEETTTLAGFSDFDFDDRLLKAIGELGWERPTEVQEAMIPLALEGKNILARAKTGSGKTAAFLLPILNSVIQLSSGSTGQTGPFTVIVAPTKELASQIYILAVHLSAPFPFLQVVNLADPNNDRVEVILQEVVDIVITTPGRLVSAINQRRSLLQNVRHVVLDEADLLLAYGYSPEMATIKEALPKTYQTIMTSATITEDMAEVKETFLTGPVVSLKLKEGRLPNSTQLTQYQINCNMEEEKFAILLSLIKLKLLVGKTIIFVSSTKRCYKLSLFLQPFDIRSAVLNSEMPANCRCQTVRQFNEGKFPFIIASDLADVVPEATEGEPGDDEPAKKKKKKSKRLRGGEDKESGVARGIDFHFVSNVVNFDFPNSADAYIHRVGRTARGFNKGTAISFATLNESELAAKVKQDVEEQMGDGQILPYNIKMKDFEPFLLRSREAIAACTDDVIKEARLADIRREILRSKQLETYFEQNPKEKAAIENEKKRFKMKINSEGFHDVPEYMIPKALRGRDLKNDDISVKANRNNYRRGKVVKARKRNAKKNDPLRSFKF